MRFLHWISALLHITVHLAGYSVAAADGVLRGAQAEPETPGDEIVKYVVKGSLPPKENVTNYNFTTATNSFVYDDDTANTTVYPEIMTTDAHSMPSLDDDVATRLSSNSTTDHVAVQKMGHSAQIIMDIAIILLLCAVLATAITIHLYYTGDKLEQRASREEPEAVPLSHMDRFTLQPPAYDTTYYNVSATGTVM